MKKKLDSVQALRALACMCVFFNHCFSKTIVVWGVSVFFYISGFLLAVRYIDDEGFVPPCTFTGAFRYSLKKIGKTYPLYLLSMLPILALELYSALNGIGETGVSEIGKRLAAVVLMIQSWIPSNHYVFAFNGVGWYISTALFTYFAFPFILQRMRRYKRDNSPCIAAAILLAAMFAVGLLLPKLGNFVRAHFVLNSDDSFERWFTYNFPPFRLFEFAIGCNLGCIYLRYGKGHGKTFIALLDTLSVLLFWAAVYIFRSGKSILASDAFSASQLFAPFCVVFVYSFAVNRGLVARVLTNRVTIFLGELSSCFFLIHMDVMKYYHIVMEYFHVPTELISVLIVPTVGGISILLSMAYTAIYNYYAGKKKIAK